MTRTRVLLPVAVIFSLVLGAVWFLLIGGGNWSARTAQQAVESSDDGTRAGVFVHDQNGAQWAYIDRHGKVVYSLPLPQPKMFPPLSENLSFSEGLAAVATDFKFGYIDTTGKMVIPQKFSEADPFHEHRARVMLEEGFQSGFIDTSGKIVIPVKYANTRSFSEGLAAVQLQDHSYWGFIDLSGNMVIPPIFDDADDFSEGLAAVRIGDKVGYIDHTGKIVIPASFHLVSQFAEGLAPVLLDHGPHKFGYIDKTGRLVIPAAFDDADIFSEGLARVRVCPRSSCDHDSDGSRAEKAKLGYIDATGKMVIPPRFREAESFSEGLAAVIADDNNEGLYINKKGEAVIVTSRLHTSFRHGLAAVSGNGTAGFIDKTGRFVIPPRFVSALQFAR
jgi:DNA-binding transcriptional regulator/RsmH inhibitor MraZ